MLFNNLTLRGIAMEDDGTLDDVGAGDASQAEVDLAESEASTAEQTADLTETDTETQVLDEVAEKSGEAMDDLQAVQDIVQGNEDQIDEVGAQLATECIARAYRTLGIRKTARQIYSPESHSTRASRTKAMRIAMEGVSDTLKKGWDWFVNLCRKIWDTIKDWWNKFLGLLGNNKKKVESLRRAIRLLKEKYEDEEDESGFKSKVADKLKTSTPIYISKEFAEAYVKSAKSKLEQVVKDLDGEKVFEEAGREVMGFVTTLKTTLDAETYKAEDKENDVNDSNDPDFEKDVDSLSVRSKAAMMKLISSKGGSGYFNTKLQEDLLGYNFSADEATLLTKSKGNDNKETGELKVGKLVKTSEFKKWSSNKSTEIKLPIFTGFSALENAGEALEDFTGELEGIVKNSKVSLDIYDDVIDALEKIDSDKYNQKGKRILSNYKKFIKQAIGGGTAEKAARALTSAAFNVSYFITSKSYKEMKSWYGDKKKKDED